MRVGQWQVLQSTSPGGDLLTVLDERGEEVKDAVVTLRGEASSIAQKELTSEYAKDIDGVKEVKNEMTVAATPEPAERTAGEKIAAPA